MADGNPLNDSQLSQLERRLRTLELPPTNRQRGQLLYACGKAAGRAEIKRRLRAATAVAVMCFCTSAALSFVLLTRGGVQTAARERPTQPPSVHRPGEERKDLRAPEPPRSDSDGDRQLTTASDFRQFAASGRGAKDNTLASASLNFPSKRILTAADRSLPDDL